MAKGAYIGVSGKARKIKKGYIGVGGTARMIKKAYVGVNGIARPCWGGGEVRYYGTITPLPDALSSSTYDISAGSTSNYAIFSQGSVPDYYGERFGLSVAYNAVLTQSNTGTVPARHDSASTLSSPNYAIFAGGDSNNKSLNTVYAYSNQLVATTMPTLAVSRTHMGCALAGGNYVFVGGSTNSGVVGTVDIYTASLTKQSVSKTVLKRHGISGVQNGAYTLFAGGVDYMTSTHATVDTVNSSLTWGTATELSNKRGRIGGTTAGSYSIFAGGIWYDEDVRPYDDEFDTVDAYSASLTRMTIASLSSKRGDVKAVTMDGLAIFLGGAIYSNAAGGRTIEVYDSTLTKRQMMVLTDDYVLGNTAVVGNYIVTQVQNTKTMLAFIV